VGLGLQARPHHAALRVPREKRVAGVWVPTLAAGFSRPCSRYRRRRARISSTLNRVTDVFSVRITPWPEGASISGWFLMWRFAGLR
jgi:hypothetical protein